MGGVIFIDTSFIIAFFNKDDDFHTDARNIIHQTMKHDPLIRFYFTDYIFDEVITFLKIRKVPFEILEQVGNTLLKSRLWSMLKITETEILKAWKFMIRYQDKDWSFTDVLSFIIMEDFQIPFFLAYDNHFQEYPKIKPWIPPFS